MKFIKNDEDFWKVECDKACNFLFYFPAHNPKMIKKCGKETKTRQRTNTFIGLFHEF